MDIVYTNTKRKTIIQPALSSKLLSGPLTPSSRFLSSSFRYGSATMALSSSQSLPASASSDRLRSSSERISPVSCSRRFRASGWALSEAWVSSLSPRDAMLDDSSLSRACGRQTRHFFLGTDCRHRSYAPQKPVVPGIFHWFRAPGRCGWTSGSASL